MARATEPRPPWTGRAAIRLIGSLVPADGRPEWLNRWNGNLVHLWVLVERGELTLARRAQALWLVHAAWRDAWGRRGGAVEWRRRVEGPGFVLACAAAALAILGAASRGFAVTRRLYECARDLGTPLPVQLNYDPRGDALVAYGFPIGLGLLIGAMMIAIQPVALRGRNWRFTAFLAGKTLLAVVLVSLVWIEGGAALRSQLHHEGLRLGIGGLGLCAAFLVGFGRTMIWCLNDQRRRCPVCLRRLTMPVTMGRWSSVFEPVTTELLCHEGHGTLCLAETDATEPEQWMELDPFWREEMGKATVKR